VTGEPEYLVLSDEVPRVVIDPRARTVRGFLLGETAWNRVWRLGGIVISCLADIPVIVDTGGLPVGRFMC
jgi:hypothetical protein